MISLIRLLGFPYEHSAGRSFRRNAWFIRTLLRPRVAPINKVQVKPQGNRSKTALRDCSSSGLESISSLRLVFLMSSDDPGPWDPRDPVAVEPSLCPSKFQDLVVSGPLEPEAAPVSKVVTRAKRLPTICSILVI